MENVDFNILYACIHIYIYTNMIQYVYVVQNHL